MEILSTDSRNGVQVTEYVTQGYEDQWIWELLRRFGATGPSPSLNHIIARRAMALLKDVQWAETVYDNPRFTVLAAEPCDHFIREAWRARLAWQRYLKNTLRSARDAVRHDCRVNMAGLPAAKRRRLEAVLRQFHQPGILIIDGKHIAPSNWPPRPQVQPSERTALLGATFGRLTIDHFLPGGRCLCKCECGNKKAVRLKHLRAARTKSCGCLRAERQRANVNRPLSQWR